MPFWFRDKGKVNQVVETAVGSNPNQNVHWGDIIQTADYTADFPYMSWSTSFLTRFLDSFHSTSALLCEVLCAGGPNGGKYTRPESHTNCILVDLHCHSTSLCWPLPFGLRFSPRFVACMVGHPPRINSPVDQAHLHSVCGQYIKQVLIGCSPSQVEYSAMVVENMLVCKVSRREHYQSIRYSAGFVALFRFPSPKMTVAVPHNPGRLKHESLQQVMATLLPEEQKEIEQVCAAFGLAV